MTLKNHVTYRVISSRAALDLRSRRIDSGTLRMMMADSFSSPSSLWIFAAQPWGQDIVDAPTRRQYTPAVDNTTLPNVPAWCFAGCSYNPIDFHWSIFDPFPRVGCAAPDKLFQFNYNRLPESPFSACEIRWGNIKSVDCFGKNFPAVRYTFTIHIVFQNIISNFDLHDFYLRLWVYKLLYSLTIIYIIAIMMSSKKCIFFHFFQKKISRNYRRLQVL